MPRTADHTARRRDIAAAVQRLVADAGMDAVTVAAVARQANCSVGLVQHYFPSKDELLLFAYRQVTTAVLDRVAARVADEKTNKDTIKTLVFDSLTHLLPVDDTRRGEYRVTRAFLGRSLDNPALAEIATATAADLRSRLATAVHNGKECGEVEPGLDPDRAATELTALVDGLAEQLYREPARTVDGAPLPEACTAILCSGLDRVFTGECHHHHL